MLRPQLLAVVACLLAGYGSSCLAAAAVQPLANTPGGVRSTSAPDGDTAAASLRACNGTAAGGGVLCLISVEPADQGPGAAGGAGAAAAAAAAATPAPLLYGRDSAGMGAEGGAEEAALVAADEAALMAQMAAASSSGEQPPAFAQLVLSRLHLEPLPAAQLLRSPGSGVASAAAWQSALEGSLQAGAAAAAGVPPAHVQTRASSSLRLSLEMPAPAPEFAAAAATALADAIKDLAGAPSALASVSLAAWPETGPPAQGPPLLVGADNATRVTARERRVLASVLLLGMGPPTAAAAAAERLRVACPALLVPGPQPLSGSACGRRLLDGQAAAAAAAARALADMMAAEQAAPALAAATAGRAATPIAAPVRGAAGAAVAPGAVSRSLLQMQPQAAGSTSPAAVQNAEGRSRAAASESGGVAGPWPLVMPGTGAPALALVPAGGPVAAAGPASGDVAVHTTPEVNIHVTQAIGVAPPHAAVDIVTRLQAWARGGLVDWAGGPSIAGVLAAAGLTLGSASPPAIVELVQPGAPPTKTGGVPLGATSAATAPANQDASGAARERPASSGSGGSSVALGAAVGAAAVAAAAAAAVFVFYVARRRTRGTGLASATPQEGLPQRRRRRPAAGKAGKGACGKYLSSAAVAGPSCAGAHGVQPLQGGQGLCGRSPDVSIGRSLPPGAPLSRAGPLAGARGTTQERGSSGASGGGDAGDTQLCSSSLPALPPLLLPALAQTPPLQALTRGDSVSSAVRFDLEADASSNSEASSSGAACSESSSASSGRSSCGSEADTGPGDGGSRDSRNPLGAATASLTRAAAHLSGSSSRQRTDAETLSNGPSPAAPQHVAPHLSVCSAPNHTCHGRSSSSTGTLAAPLRNGLSLPSDALPPCLARFKGFVGGDSAARLRAPAVTGDTAAAAGGSAGSQSPHRAHARRHVSPFEKAGNCPELL